jgi:peptide/nickel transport system permease protein
MSGASSLDGAGRPPATLGRAPRLTPTGRVAAAGLLAIFALAAFGPLLAPYSPTEIVGIPLRPPSARHWLGTDALGRDALSRYLNGGRLVLIVAFGSIALAAAIAVPLGAIAGYRRGTFDIVTLGVVDLLLAFPPLILSLWLIAGLGTSIYVIVVAVAIVYVPRMLRLIRGVTVDVATSAYVEAAVARGEPTLSIILRDVIPNCATPFFADVGIRVAGAILLFSSLSYLGVGTRPPTADWGLLISENRVAISVQVWVVVPPAATLAALAVFVSLLADSFGRASQRSRDIRGL